MSGTFYDGELAELSNSFSAAMSANIDDLKQAIASTAESSIIAVGSGGSFTVASLLCNLHESYTGRVSRASTPLEIICNPTLAAASPVFLISAEGKNPDIVEALERARRHSSRTVHVLTNRASSPLMEHVRELPEVTPMVQCSTARGRSKPSQEGGMIAKILGILLFGFFGIPIMALGVLAGVATQAFTNGLLWADWFLEKMK